MSQQPANNFCVYCGVPRRKDRFAHKASCPRRCSSELVVRVVKQCALEHAHAPADHQDARGRYAWTAEATAAGKPPTLRQGDLRRRFARISGPQWARLYFDMYHQLHGERAGDAECLADAERRLALLEDEALAPTH